VLFECGEECFRPDGGLTEAVLALVLAAVGDGGEKFFLGFGSKPVECRDFVGFAGAFEAADGVDVQLVAQEFDFFGTETGEFEKFKQFRSKFFGEGVKVSHPPGGEVFGEFGGDGLADAFDGIETVGFRCGDEVAGEEFDSAGGIGVGPDFEGVFAFEFEHTRDRFESVDHLLAGGAWRVGGRRWGCHGGEQGGIAPVE